LEEFAVDYSYAVTTYKQGNVAVRSIQILSCCIFAARMRESEITKLFKEQKLEMINYRHHQQKSRRKAIHRNTNHNQFLEGGFDFACINFKKSIPINRED
jgi:hypothetical protein